VGAGLDAIGRCWTGLGTNLDMNFREHHSYSTRCSGLIAFRASLRVPARSELSGATTQDGVEREFG
jgi:hypothetical protein